MSEPRPRTESELVELVRSIDVRAPEELHREVESLIAARSPSAGRRRMPFGTGPPGLRGRLAGAIAIATVAAVVIAVSVSGGGSSTLTLPQASALTLRPATVPAPAESASNSAQLAAAVEGVPFPYWEERFGWRSTGARTDRVGGRTVTTVFYQDGRRRRIGYAIVAGTPAPRLSGGVVAWRNGVPYRLLSESGAAVVSWLRDGRLCVISGRGVDSATLLRLASWNDRRTVAS